MAAADFSGDGSGSGSTIICHGFNEIAVGTQRRNRRARLRHCMFQLLKLKRSADLARYRPSGSEPVQGIWIFHFLIPAGFEVNTGKRATRQGRILELAKMTEQSFARTCCDDRLPLPPNMPKAFSAVEARWYLLNSDLAEGFFTQTRTSRWSNLKASQVANQLLN